MSVGSSKGHGVCVQCARPRCFTTFHVTCAQYKGLVSETGESYSGLVCHKHSTLQVGSGFVVGYGSGGFPSPPQEKAVQIKEGERVYADRGDR